MKSYTGELAPDYESGGRVVVVKAISPREALHKLNLLCREYEMVIQIHDGGWNDPLVYDYMNGFDIYR